MSIVLERESPEPARPYRNLMPVVDLLVSEGNALVDGGFLHSPAGWYCRMARPLDLPRVRREFDIPETIELSTEFDSILDRLSWCAIEGSGASSR